MTKRLVSVIAAFVATAGVAVMAQEKISITVPPYLQNLTEDEVTIIWETDIPGTGWVEIAPYDGESFYAEEKERHFDSRLGIKTISRLHKVRITGLEKGKRYAYRVFSQQARVDDGSSKVTYGAYASTNVYKKEPLSFTTPVMEKPDFSFAVINDIHGDSSLVYDLFRHCDMEKMDFVVGNGDLVSAMNDENTLSRKFLRHAAAVFGSAKPLVAVRGNHETRGSHAQHFTDYFPSVNDGLPYYAFRYGDAFFIIADCGEDKPDSDIEYYGRADFDSFREDEAKWLRSIVNSSEYHSAKYHIAFIHMPPVGEKMWHGEQEVRRLFLPIFNNADLDVMFCGHTHSYRYWEKDEAGNGFPVIVNDNETIITVEVSEKGISAKVTDRQGKTLQTFAF